jgi:hypothetical protein
MAKSGKNPSGSASDLLRQGRALGAREILRQHSIVGAIAKQHATLTGFSRAGEVAKLLTENRKAIQGAGSVLKNAQAARGAQTAFLNDSARNALGMSARHKATLSSFGLATPPSNVLDVVGRATRQAGMLGMIYGDQSKTIFDPALKRQAGVLGVLSGRERKTIFDDVLSGSGAYKASIAAAAMQGNAHSSVIRHAAKLAHARIAPTLAEYGQVNLRAVMASGEVLDRMVRIPPINLLSLVPSEALERTRELYEALDRVEGRWADDALWFLFSRLTHKSMFLFDRLNRREQVEAATLDALERVLREGTFIKLLCEAVEIAPYMSDYQREILTHALDHVRKGDYRLAISHLLDGLEGAIVRAAMARSIIDEDRWLIGKPREKRNRRHGVDAIVKEMSLDQEYERFLHRGVFGKRGNAARHGNVESDERRRALLLVVAIAGWTDVFMGLTASETLVDAMTMFLPEAVSRQRQFTS